MVQVLSSDIKIQQNIKRELMKGISSKTLARRLKELEKDGILCMNQLHT